MSLGREDPLEKEMATHSSILAWRIPWTEEPGRLQSMGSQRVGHDWAISLRGLDTRLPCLNLCHTWTTGAKKGRPSQQEQTLGFKVKAERERRPRWLEGESGFRDGYHVRASLSWCMVIILFLIFEPTYQLSPIIYHPKTFSQADWLTHFTLVHRNHSPALWFCSWLLLPEVPPYNTQCKFNSSWETVISWQPQVTSYLSETTPHAPFKYSSSLSLFCCYLLVSFASFIVA